MLWKDYSLINWDKPQVDKKIILSNGKILLLKLVSSSSTPESGSKNLICIDSAEEIKWIAELPKMYPKYGLYQDVELENGLLKAWCGSIYCEIDLETGKILKEEFVK